MFRSIVLRPTSTDNRIDIGVLAEAMVFYQTVDLSLGEAALENLVKSIGLDSLSDLLSSGHLRLNLLSDMTATHHSNLTGTDIYDFVTVLPLRRDQTPRDPLEVLIKVFERATGKRGKSTRAANRLLRFVNFRTISDGVDDSAGISSLARLDLDDRQYVQFAIGDVLHSMMPGYALPSGWNFTVNRTAQGLVVHTNLNLVALNREYEKTEHPGHADSITIAGLIGWIQEARADIHLASEHLSELGTNEISASIIRRKLGAIAKVTNLREIQLFTQLNLGEGKAIREAINAGDRNITDLLTLVSESEKFRSWLGDVPEDANLVSEYLKAVTHRGWSERLPTKLIRLFIFSGAGLIASAATHGVAAALAGLALSAADSLLLDKLISGWKPSQFVTGPLNEFTGKG